MQKKALKSKKNSARGSMTMKPKTRVTKGKKNHRRRTSKNPRFFGSPVTPVRMTEYIVAGGGVHNRTLMRQLRAGLEPLGISVSTIDEHGIPSQAKEAMAFALLAWLRWNSLPGNVPSATGAKREAILGRITLA